MKKQVSNPLLNNFPKVTNFWKVGFLLIGILYAFISDDTALFITPKGWEKPVYDFTFP
jgi:hypothetical protein